VRLAPSQESAPPTPGGASLSRAPSDARRAYLAQKRAYTERRGATLVGNVAVPKTTTADVLELATWWTNEIDKLRAGGDLTDADRAAIARWRACLDVISRRAAVVARTGVYPDNPHAWACIAQLANHLAERSVTPSWWQMARAAVQRGAGLADQVIDTVGEKLDRIGDRLAANAGKVSAEAGRAVGAAAVDSAVSAAVVPVALAAGGIVAGVVLLRATSPAARARRTAQRAAKAGRRATKQKARRR